jgi:hypothetical protein
MGVRAGTRVAHEDPCLLVVPVAPPDDRPVGARSDVRRTLPGGGGRSVGPAGGVSCERRRGPDDPAACPVGETRRG